MPPRKHRPVTAADDSERLRSVSSAEAASLTTAAGTMLLGILTENLQAREAGMTGSHQQTVPPTGARDPQSLSHSSSGVSADNKAHVAPTQAHHGGAGPSAGAAATPHQDLHDADPAVPAPLPHSATEEGSDVRVEAPTPAAQPTPAETPLPTLTDGLHGQAAESFGAHLATTLSETVDGIVGGLNQSLANLATGVDQLTSAALAVPAAGADALVSATFAAAAAVPDAGLPVLDSSAAIPITPDLSIVQIGFLGQPQADGHDASDGAFSALGLHHF